MPAAGPETFLEILEDFLSRQIGRSTLCGKDNWSHSKIFFLTTINFVLSLFFLFINPQIFICTYFFLFLVLLFISKFISFYFSYFYNVFSLYYTFPTFLVLYFCYSRFQCLFSFMALLVWVLSSFSVSLFILPFFLWVWVYEFVCSYLINVAFNMCLRAFSVSSLFVCALEFFYPISIFLFFPSVLYGLWTLGAPARAWVWTSKVG